MIKYLLLAALTGVAGCSSAPTKTEAAKSAEDPTHAAVVAYLKKTLDDPASYQPAYWGKTKPFQQRSLDIDKAADLFEDYRHQHELGQAQSEHFIRMADMSTTPKQGLAELDKAKRVIKLYAYRADSIKKISDKFAASTDTTRLGSVVSHTFRAKNKMGALVLDSAVFTVLKTGEVQVSK